MKRPLHGTMRLRNSPAGEQIQNGSRRVKLLETQLPLDVAQNCFVLVFPLQLFLCWKFRNFLLRNKALAYFSYLEYNIQKETSFYLTTDIQRKGALKPLKHTVGQGWVQQICKTWCANVFKFSTVFCRSMPNRFVRFVLTSLQAMYHTQLCRQLPAVHNKLRCFSRIWDLVMGVNRLSPMTPIERVLCHLSKKVLCSYSCYPSFAWKK